MFDPMFGSINSESLGRVFSAYDRGDLIPIMVFPLFRGSGAFVVGAARPGSVTHQLDRYKRKDEVSIYIEASP